MNKTSMLRIFLVLILLLAAGCSGVRTGEETPAVTVNHFRALPSSGMAPRFEIGLHIINPNDTVLEVRGISYTASIEGHRILVGVAKEIPAIEAFSEGDVVLQASTDMLSGISLIADLMSQPRNSFAYELEVKLSVGGLRRRITVEKSGEISLGGRNRTGSDAN